MTGRLIVLVAVVAVGYWYWSGPYQARVHPSYDQKLRSNAEAMRECIYRKKYAASRTLKDAGDPEETCSRQLNLYHSDGEWHSYDDVRQVP